MTLVYTDISNVKKKNVYSNQYGRENRFYCFLLQEQYVLVKY